MTGIELPGDETMAQARFIIENGRLIHERVSRIFIQLIADSGDDTLRELTVNQLQAIKAIAGAEEVGISELAKMLCVSPPSASVMVDRLTEKNILIRERSIKDRRKVVVRLSDRICGKMDRIHQEIFASFVGLVKKLGPDTTRKWCEVLSRVKTVMDENMDETDWKFNN